MHANIADVSFLHDGPRCLGKVALPNERIKFQYLMRELARSAGEKAPYQPGERGNILHTEG
jgi:hypothetical protein